MAQRFSSLASVRKQQLLIEFASLKDGSPPGVYLTLTPGDATLWSGVIFVRRGPYAPAILRFQISFPPAYPALPPLVTFSTEIFHPLLTPLTTYTYTTGSSDTDPVSATDDERLPPGGFSLRHGFPQWFGRSRKMASLPLGAGRYHHGADSPGSDRQEGRIDVATPARKDALAASSPESGSSSVVSASPGTQTPSSPRLGATSARVQITTSDVLRYIKSAFDDEVVLDAIPLEAAGNPGAWHAWRSYRGKLKPKDSGDSAAEKQKSDGEGDKAREAGYRLTAGGTRRPAEWNWEGVWEERARRGIEGSVADPVLYGDINSGDDLIRFLNMDGDMVETVKDNIKRNVDFPTQR